MKVKTTGVMGRTAHRLRWGAVALATAVLAACGGGGGGGGGPPEVSSRGLYISNGDGTADRADGQIHNQISVNTGANQGIDQDINGDLYQANDLRAGVGEPGSVHTICRFDTRNGDSFSSTHDRLLGGADTGLTGLVNPKGIALAHKAGLLMIANFNGRNVKVFGSSATGNAPPVATTTLPANPWDLVYDEAGDRLFVALTDGTIGVIDGYVASDFGASNALRLITPVDVNRTPLGGKLHGIAYNAGTDQLIVADVRAETAAEGSNFASDGALYVIDRASRVSGLVQPSKIVTGPATRLGNPTDIVLIDTELRVAEAANDVLLVFPNFLAREGGNVVPGAAIVRADANSLLAESVQTANPDISDLDHAGFTLTAVATTSNPASASDPAFGQIARLAPALDAEQTTFSADLSLENIAFDQTGDAFVSFDNGANAEGGILIVNRLAVGRDGGEVLTSRDRRIAGAKTQLESPKGIDIVDGFGWLLVADNSAAEPSVRVFSTCAAGDTPPLAVTKMGNDPAGNPRRPWDVDYDPLTDRLYVALTDGTVAVFDQYSRDLGGNDGPDRIIVPADALGTAKVSRNLHGVVYVAGRDILILSDVGDPANASDGQLLVIRGASTASGLTATSARFNGALTQLGNPVDIAFDGVNLYVAEKSNNAILRFDDFLTLAGGNIAPDANINRPSPESVALAPSYLAATPER
ncbi:MAG: hypothetical protein U1F68_17860 [Gammaproteobacteria bacterium]